MQKTSKCLSLLAPLAIVAGCTVANSGLDESSRDARLPTGVTLLESDREECEGVVELREGSVRTNDRARTNDRTGLLVRQGQNATFEVDDEHIELTCVGESSTNSETIDCPTDTSHVRISRSTQGDDFVLECYG